MLSDVPRSLTKRVRRNGKRFAGASLLLLLLAGASGFVAAQDVDVSIESLHIGWVEMASAQDRSSLGLDKALIGDTIRLSATVKNLGTGPASQFNVDFFFTETISGEHGKIGSQAVIGLEPGEERRPVVTFDSTVFAPGVYVFSAEADPEQANSESARCNNFAPLGECAGDLQQSEDRYKLTLLQAGSHISELSLRTEFTICQMGSLTTILVADAYNVGTEAFSIMGTDVTVYGYYRFSLDPPANGFSDLSEDTTGSPQPLTKIVSLSTPGGEGSIRITLDYKELSAQFQPSDNAIKSGEVLGRANSTQIRLSVNPLAGGTPQDLYLPAQFALARFYSDVDLWTFPARTHCVCDDYTDIETVTVDPAVAGGLVFHAVTSSSGDRLHVLKIGSGEEKPDAWSPASGAAILDVAAFYDSEAAVVHRVFVAGDDGLVYALDGADKESGSFLSQRWISPVNIVIGTAFLEVSSDGSLLIVGSDAGAYVLSSLDGSILRSDATHAVTTAPAYGNVSGTVWFASDETIYGLRADGSECFNNDIQDQITSNLMLNQDETAVFFGTDSGDFFAMNAAATGETCDRLALETSLVKRTLLGIDLVSDGGDAVIYVTDSIGDIARAEYDHGDGFEKIVRGEDLEPRAISTAPAILPTSNGRDAVVVFVTGEIRVGGSDRPILQGMDKDLEEYETVSVWGTPVPFVFKPEEGDAIPSALLTPIVDVDSGILLVASSDGFLYAFDLSQFD